MLTWERGGSLVDGLTPSLLFECRIEDRECLYGVVFVKMPKLCDEDFLFYYHLATNGFFPEHIRLVPWHQKLGKLYSLVIQSVQRRAVKP